MFIAGFAFLTVAAAIEQGVTVASFLSVFILVLLAVGIVGALRNPPGTMSTAPFMTPDQSRLRRQAGRAPPAPAADRRCACCSSPLCLRRRAGRRAEPPLLAPRPRALGRRAGTAPLSGAAKPPGPALSPAGLPLAPPALTLAGIQTPSADPIQLRFPHPPRAGLLFNLDTGQVLWQRNAYRRACASRA